MKYKDTEVTEQLQNLSFGIDRFGRRSKQDTLSVNPFIYGNKEWFGASTATENAIRKVKSANEYKALITRLNLQNKKIEMLDGGLLSFRNLTELSLTGNYISAIEETSRLLPQSLRILHLNGNTFRQIPNLSLFSSLVHLGMSHNLLRSINLKDLSEILPLSILSLDLSWNLFENLSELINALKTIKHIKSLALLGNPIYLHPLYVPNILEAMPDLTSLDDEESKHLMSLLPSKLAVEELAMFEFNLFEITDFVDNSKKPDEVKGVIEPKEEISYILTVEIPGFPQSLLTTADAILVEKKIEFNFSSSVKLPISNLLLSSMKGVKLTLSAKKYIYIPKPAELQPAGSVLKLDKDKKALKTKEEKPKSKGKEEIVLVRTLSQTTAIGCCLFSVREFLEDNRSPLLYDLSLGISNAKVKFRVNLN